MSPPKRSSSPIAQEIDVPFCAAAIGEGKRLDRAHRRRDYRDVGADLASHSTPSSKLEAIVLPRQPAPAGHARRWLLVDRALVNNREPTATAEQFGLLSYLKTLKRKIPERERVDQRRCAP
jgi:hypothetical protein